MKGAWLACAAALVCAASAHAGALRGRVFDPAGAVVQRAIVEIGSALSFSDEQGRFAVHLAPGRYTIKVVAPGFGEYRANLEVTQADLQWDVKLAIAPLGSREVVSEKAPRAENAVESWSDNVHASVDSRQIRESGARDAGEALAELDGLAKIRKGAIANDTLMRGLGHDNLNILVDGGRIYGACPSSMDPRPSHVDFAEIERVEVTKGAFDLRSQGSLGGSINIVTKDPESGLRITPSMTSGSFGFFNPSLTASLGGEKFWGMAGYSFRVSEPYTDGMGRRFTTLTNYSPAGAASDAFRVSTGWFRLGGQPRPDEHLKLMYTRQAGGQTMYPYLSMDAAYDNADRLTASWEKFGSDAGSNLRVEGFASRVKHWMTDELRTSAVGAPLGFSMGSFAETAAVGARTEVKKGGLVAGAEMYWRKWDGVSSSRSMGVYSSQHFIPAADSRVAGAFVEYSRTLAARLRLTAAARLDGAITAARASDARTDLYWAYKLTRSLSNADVMPSASIRIAYATGAVEWFAGAGSTVRIPDPVERYVSSQRMGTDFIGNPVLRPTRNSEGDAGFNWRTRYFLIRPTLFYSFLQNFVTVQNQARLVPGNAMANSMARSYANTNARSYGGEINFSIPLRSVLAIYGGASFTRSTKQALPQLGIFDRDVAEIPPLRAHATVRYGNRLAFLETTFTAVAAQRRIDRDLLESPTPGYGVVDLKAGLHTRHLSFALGIANLLNRFYYEHCSYQRDPFRSGTRVPEPGRNFYVTMQYTFGESTK